MPDLGWALPHFSLLRVRGGDADQGKLRLDLLPMVVRFRDACGWVAVPWQMEWVLLACYRKLGTLLGFFLAADLKIWACSTARCELGIAAVHHGRRHGSQLPVPD
ncbi:hypothetical protein ACLOJK_036684 [Asimina triloba]